MPPRLDAREFYADTLERDLIASAERSDNPVGYIVRLKALRPAEYIEKHAVMSLNVHADLPSADAAQLLRDMLGTLTEKLPPPPEYRPAPTAIGRGHRPVRQTQPRVAPAKRRAEVGRLAARSTHSSTPCGAERRFFATPMTARTCDTPRAPSVGLRDCISGGPADAVEAAGVPVQSPARARASNT